MSNLSRWVEFHARVSPDRTAISYEGHRVTYGMLWRRIGRIAGLLRGHGVERGDRVAMLMKNSAAFIEIAMAISHVGAVSVPINFRLAPGEVDDILRDSGAILLFQDEQIAAWKAPVATTVVVTDDALADASRLAPDSGDDSMASVAPDDLMRIMYTSGTTDRPKGATHSYANFHAKTADHIVALGLSSWTRLLVSGPLYHVGAFDLPGVGVLLAGGMLCIQRDFSADGALDLIERERLNASWFAPVMTGEVLACQQRSPRDVSSMEWTIGGGERTPEARVRLYAQCFPHARYIDAYGLTETCSGDTFMEAGCEIEKIGSVGRPVPQVDITIRDDQGLELPAGQVGEICIRGTKVTRGYWRAEEKTAASFFGTWFRSGDAGYLDAEGFLFLTDRIKDMIISGGENIASSEVERAILELAAIQDAAVIGLPDARWGERPVAFIVLKGQQLVSEEEVRAHCRALLAPFKIPDRVLIVPSLPRSNSGKVLKRDLRLSMRNEP
jgi:fatty-acyl-CoA synthase